MPPARYALKLMFEWGGCCLWCDSDAARDRFGVGAIDDLLPLSAATRARLDALSAWHDQSLDWSYPPDPSPWSAEERARFDASAEELRAIIQSELGPEFEIVYKPL